MLISGDPADGRGSRQSRRLPDGPGGVDDHRQHRRRDPKLLQQRLVPFDGRIDQGGDGRIGGIGHVEGSAAGGGAAGEGPGDPAVDRPETELAPFGPRPLRVDLVEDGHHLGRRRIRCQPDPLGLQHQAGPDRAQVLPADAGATGLPVARSHTMLDARWLAIPTPATGPPSASAARAPSRMASAMRAASNSTRPGAGRVGQQRDAVLVLDAGIGSHNGGADARRPDVDDENAPPARAHAQGAGPNGEARPNLPGLRMPLGSKVALRPASTSKPVPSARGRKRERLSPMPWWWLMAAPWARVALVTVSQAWR